MSKVIGYQFVVEGEGQFPTDMLRYDACYPSTTEDAVNLPLSVYTAPRDLRQHRKVTLRSTLRPPTVARWVSFGWSVSDIEVIR